MVIYKVDVIQVVFEYVYVVGDVLGVGLMAYNSACRMFYNLNVVD